MVERWWTAVRTICRPQFANFTSEASPVGPLSRCSWKFRDTKAPSSADRSFLRVVSAEGDWCPRPPDRRVRENTGELGPPEDEAGRPADNNEVTTPFLFLFSRGASPPAKVFHDEFSLGRVFLNRDFFFSYFLFIPHLA